jgi:hypothetical protein
MDKLTEKDINRLVRIIRENNELDNLGDEWGWFDQFSFGQKKPKMEKTKKELESLKYKNVREGNVLVIHPDDRSTDFLKPSYADLDATVLTQRDEFYNLAETMKRHNRIIMMGHGSPNGLFMPQIEGVEEGENGELFEYSDYSINDTYADILREKRTVCVWCNADKYVVPNDLHGFYTGMVISELCEADYCDVKGCNPKQLEQSSTKFTMGLKEAIKVDGPESLNIFKEIYNNPQNPIMGYNRKRLYFR